MTGSERDYLFRLFVRFAVVLLVLLGAPALGLKPSLLNLLFGHPPHFPSLDFFFCHGGSSGAFGGGSLHECATTESLA